MLDEQQKKRLQELLGDLEEAKIDLADLREVLAAREQALLAEIAGYEAGIEALKLKIEATNSRIQGRQKTLIADITRAQRVVEQRLQDVRTFCHELPREAIESGASLRYGKHVVNISRTEFTTIYDTHRMLQDLPHLEEIYIDGDPVVQRTISPEVLERLVAEGQLSEEDVEPYRTEIKKRSPQTFIREDEE